jgi:hypothetical protein
MRHICAGSCQEERCSPLNLNPRIEPNLRRWNWIADQLNLTYKKKKKHVLRSPNSTLIRTPTMFNPPTLTESLRWYAAMENGSDGEWEVGRRQITQRGATEAVRNRARNQAEENQSSTRRQLTTERSRRLFHSATNPQAGPGYPDEGYEPFITQAPLFWSTTAARSVQVL